ncbi:fumarate reductase cytochrome b subunit [Hydrogenimonas urashimensis]|uniref:fumarate reductase cytochrome b subunit n=1 Tax=Hydrogenimonas urashimensis TaxID=2740515 RepID=UPI00191543FC|nr:fumarate reductase cytochrome b subunit [Hydrogenimonas urashimensis]
MSKLHHSRIPAYLDVTQSVTGLLLALFIVAHIIFEASILLGPGAMEKMTLFFEGYYLFGERHPIIITILGIIISALFLVHAALAIRKIPSTWHQYRTFRKHMKRFRHDDTTLWMVQVVTGFAMFYLGSVHIYMMMANPSKIGPYLSAQRVVEGWMWPLYLALLFCVVLHAFIGLYRLALKWGWFEGSNYRQSRRIMKRIMRAAILIYIVIGLASLGTYVSIGLDAGQKRIEKAQQ